MAFILYKSYQKLLKYLLLSLSFKVKLPELNNMENGTSLSVRSQKTSSLRSAPDVKSGQLNLDMCTNRPTLANRLLPSNQPQILGARVTFSLVMPRIVSPGLTMIESAVTDRVRE